MDSCTMILPYTPLDELDIWVESNAFLLFRVGTDEPSRYKDLRVRQDRNAYEAIDVQAGKLTEVRRAQLRNTLPSIFVHAGKLTEVRLKQYANAYDPILLTLLFV